MKLLLDTHAFLWWLTEAAPLSMPARAAIGDPGNEVFVSASTAWEITTKVRIGKLPEAASVAADLEAEVIALGFKPLAVTFAHGQAAGNLPGAHRDTFDRMLIAQALLDDMTLVSNELVFDAFGVRRLW